MVNSQSLRPWLMLRAIPGVGDAILLKLVQAFRSPDAVFSAAGRFGRGRMPATTGRGDPPWACFSGSQATGR